MIIFSSNFFEKVLSEANWVLVGLVSLRSEATGHYQPLLSSNSINLVVTSGKIIGWFISD